MADQPRTTRSHSVAWVPEPPTAAQLTSWSLDPSWSRTIEVDSHDGSRRRWHVLDSWADRSATGTQPDPEVTVVCVHGNPTWAYAWATFLRTFGDRCRVVAIDQLGMGYSERTGGRRRYATRVRDLADIIDALDICDHRPLVLAAHDWGGAIAMGWAVEHPQLLSGMVLCNTGIAVPEGRKSPSLIRLAASAPLRDLVCRRTNTFVDGTVRLSGSKLSAADRDAFRAPYPTPSAREAIADFVGDVPLRPGGTHPSEASRAAVADKVHRITAPVLLAWGAADPVFNDDFAADLAGRFPDSTTHRFPKANHLVMAEADVAGVVDVWLRDLVSDRPPLVSGTDEVEALWAAVDERRTDDATAIVDMASKDEVSWADFAQRVDSVASELCRRGLEPGDRVAMLVEPGVDLIAAVYGVWRAGGVTVIADRGLGLRGLGAAVRSARPSWVIGTPKTLAAASALRWAPRAVRVKVSDLVHAPVGLLPVEPSPDDRAAVLFTSGATGPAKGVRYRHRQLSCQRDALRTTYDITPDDRLVAAFAPFALYGPALGITTALPDCDVTAPGQLTAAALDDACQRIDATLAFASPAALANVVSTAEGTGVKPGLRGLRLMMSAGAPVPVETLRAFGLLAPTASLRTPYGMTEALPVADIDLAQIEAAIIDDPAGGVCVGVPVDGAEVRILPLDFDVEDPPAPLAPGETGEIVVSAPWVSDGYDGLWSIERMARPSIVDAAASRTIWHRSGDVGHLDAQGRLWVEGRAVHDIRSADGVITSVPVERQVESALGFQRVAAVGVGPAGVQQLVVVIEDVRGSDGLASSDVTDRVRSVLDHPVAAVLTLRKLPVDIRHNAKIDRIEVAAWADAVLAGRRARRPAR